MTSPRLAALLAAALLAGCDERADAQTPDAAPPPPKPAPSASAPAAPRPSAAPAAPASGEFKVQKLVLTSEVKNKEPVDKLTVAEAGQRVWAHVTVRNRTEGTRPVTLAFLVNEGERSKVELKIDPSWSYRTWGYVTLRGADSGELVVEVRDEGGTVMERARLPIKAKGK